MTGRIHDHEFDTSANTVRALLTDQCPQLSELALVALHNSGTSNAMWRLGDDFVVRMPRTRDAADSVALELDLLPGLVASSLGEYFAVPTVRYAGEPNGTFEHPWAVFDWLPGDDAWATRHEVEAGGVDLAIDVAAAVHQLRDLTAMPAPVRTAGERGGPVSAVFDALDRWLAAPTLNAASLLDVHRVRYVADACREAAGDVDCVFLHGDLIPGNLLTAAGRLTAIIDWGSAGYGDPAQDLAPAWSVFDGRAREAFVEAIDADEATWLRARAFELEHAVGGVLYYAPRKHPLADVMEETLQRLLA